MSTKATPANLHYMTLETPASRSETDNVLQIEHLRPGYMYLVGLGEMKNSAEHHAEKKARKTPKVDSDKFHYRKNRALINNPVGVYVIENNFESNMAELGGYLELDNTGQIHELFASPPTKQLLDSWRVSRDNGAVVVPNSSTDNFEHELRFHELVVKEDSSDKQYRLSIHSRSRKEDDRLLDQGIDLLKAAFKEVGYNAMRIDKKNIRPPMSELQQKTLVGLLFKDTTVLYPPNLARLCRAPKR
ncbi:MAG: hypothetical protein Q9190_003053 [Brigantiaea leucoxantha]